MPAFHVVRLSIFSPFFREHRLLRVSDLLISAMTRRNKAALQADTDLIKRISNILDEKLSEKLNPFVKKLIVFAKNKLQKWKQN